MLSMILFTLSSFYIAAETPTYSSGPQQVALIELYSSEGCSSCPPADHWVSQLKTNPKVFKDFIPINFHVDYWNYLGWTDRFSNKSFSQRQRRYAQEWQVDRVYTPAFVLNGKEWRRRNISSIKKPNVGKLTANKTTSGKYQVVFSPQKTTKKPLVVHTALLGHGLTTKVRSGENAGKTLSHEFVVLKTASQNLSKKTKNYQTQINQPKSSSNKAQSYSLVFWVTEAGSQRPLQVTGGPL